MMYKSHKTSKPLRKNNEHTAFKLHSVHIDI